MKNTRLYRLVSTAMFAALVCVATMTIQIRSPLGGYFNLGDCVVLLAAFVLGPLGGAAAGGIGSALADLLAGYAIYAPGTLAIKALTGLTAGLIYAALLRRSGRFGCKLGGAVLGGTAAELLMVLGYFLYELPMYGLGACVQTALVTNLPQAAVGLVSGLALYLLLDRARLAEKLNGGFHHA